MRNKLPKNVKAKCLVCKNIYITAEPITQLYCVECIRDKKNLLQPNN